ncbi:MAG: N,N-dimethylformamidase beta subunit family domain-containing protein, partial [Gaiellaceae bacterium]
GERLHLIEEWRKLGRPEAALCGVQYIASDRGERHAPFTVMGADVAPWAFEGTGLGNGSQFGLYGIEIDARQPSSPAGTTLLATIPDLFGPGRSAEMTYYEHTSGARVFSAGALNFGGQILLWPQTDRLLQNVWARLA